MAEAVYLTLEIQGRRIEGESTVQTMERENTIVCESYEHALTTSRAPGTVELAAKRQHRPVTITKRVDKSTPLLLRALCTNERVTKAEFRFFRPSPAGGEEHFYTVLLEDGFVSAVEQLSDDDISAHKTPPTMERVSFVFRSITWTYEAGGATHRDDLATARR